MIKTTDVQRHGIVPLISNDTDILIQAPAGQGKTATFGIGALQICAQHLKDGYSFQQGPLIVILEPTTRMAEQCHKELCKLGKFTDIGVIMCVGGIPEWENKAALFPKAKSNWNRTTTNNEGTTSPKFPGIVVGSLGRINALIDHGHLRMNQVKLIVLDECDQLVDSERDDTAEQTKRIVKECGNENVRLAMFSATLTTNTLQSCKFILRHPGVLRSMNASSIISRSVVLHYVECGFDSEFEKDDMLCNVLDDIKNWGSIMIFLKRKKDIEFLMNNTLIKYDVTDNLEEFRNGKFNVMLCTDALARGIDIKHVGVVINYQMPLDREYFVHRVGRAGRGNKRGLAITLADKNEMQMLRGIEEIYCCSITELPPDALNATGNSDMIHGDNEPANRKKESEGVAVATKSESVPFDSRMDAYRPRPRDTSSSFGSSIRRDTSRRENYFPVPSNRFSSVGGSKQINLQKLNWKAPTTAVKKQEKQCPEEKKWKVVLTDITNIFKQSAFGTNKKANKKKLPSWIALGLKVVGKDKLLLEIHNALVKNGCNNQIAKYCKILCTDDGCGSGMKFLEPFIEVASIESQYRWINSIRTELAEANFPTIEFQGNAGKQALDAVLATVYDDLSDDSEIDVLEWVNRQGLQTCKGIVEYLKEDDVVTKNNICKTEEKDDREIASACRITALEKENAELKKQMLMFAQENMELKQQMSESGSSIPPSSVGSSRASSRSTLRDDLSSCADMSFGTFTRDDMKSIDSGTIENRSENIGYARVKSFADAAAPSGDGDGEWTLKKSKSIQKKSSRAVTKAATLSRGLSRKLQIGDKVMCKVNKSVTFGTFVFYRENRKNGKAGKTETGLLHRDAYTTALRRQIARNRNGSLDLFQKGDMITAYLLGYNAKGQPRLTMVDPNDENNY